MSEFELKGQRKETKRVRLKAFKKIVKVFHENYVISCSECWRMPDKLSIHVKLKIATNARELI